MITVHIIVDDADAASAWYRDVFGGLERSRIVLPDQHAFSPAPTGP